MMMRMSIVIVALLYSVSAQAICQPARTWTDGGVTYDAKCMHRLGPGWVHIANPYQVWAYSQMKPGDIYFKPGADFDEKFGKFAVALGICAWAGDPKARPQIDQCIDLMQHAVTDGDAK